jgi:UDPglucose 6-dehydrogenase
LRFAGAIQRALPRTSTVGLLGLAFKAGTPDTRESPAVALARQLVQSGLKVIAYDPAVRKLPEEPSVLVRSAIVDACTDADAVVIATEWPEFAEMDLAALRRVTRGDLLFDGRGLISRSRAAAAGFRYRGFALTEGESPALVAPPPERFSGVARPDRGPVARPVRAAFAAQAPVADIAAGK